MKKTLLLVCMAMLFTMSSYAEDFYRVVGDSRILNGTTDWDTTNAQNTMSTTDNETYTLTVFKCNLVENYWYEFKIIKNGDYDQGQWPSSNYIIKFSVDGDASAELSTGEYDITYTFNKNTGAISVSYYKESDVVYSVVGDNTTLFSEAWNTGINFMNETENGYELTFNDVVFDSPTTIKYKICKNNSWDGAIGDNGNDISFELKEAGTYTITFLLTINETASASQVVYEKFSGFATEYATLSSKNALDFTDSNIDAYVASSISGNQVNMTKVTQVPALTGLFIKTSNDYAKVISDAAAINNNYLKASDGTEVAASTSSLYHYVLADQNGIGFYNLATGVTIPAGKAYLETTSPLTTDGAKVALSFEGEATGISEVYSHESDEWYTINGVRIVAPTKGLYIHNGKKVMIK